MIVKIKSRKNKTYRQLIEYMLHDNDRLSGREGFVVAHNLKGNKIDSWVNQLKELEVGRVLRRKDSVTMTHEILSWHKDDARHITAEKMEQMTREYIRLRVGVRGAKVLAIPHYNKEHYHVHLLVSGVDTTGKAMRMSRGEFGDIKKQVQQHQITNFRELTKSVVAHGRKSKLRVNDQEVQMKQRMKKVSIHEKVREAVLECQAQARSQEDFLVQLQRKNLEVYVRGGKLYGVVQDNRKFRFGTLGVQLDFDVEKALNRLQSKRKARGKSRHR